MGCLSSEVIATLPPLSPAQLGAAGFLDDYQLSYPVVAGAMANGIASVELVRAMADGGMLGIFGAAGLSLEAIDAAITQLSSEAGGLSRIGFNLIHTPGDTDAEARVVDLYIKRGISVVEAAAFMKITLPLVRYRLHGIHQAPDGTVVAPNRIIAKVSRVELAEKFFAPPPTEMVEELRRSGQITQTQADLAVRIPLAQDITAEADSGGHTDNRPSLAMLPTFLSLRDRLQGKHGYHLELRVGGAGGIGTPAAAAAVFAMGAAYIVTGSVNQACVESGTSPDVKELLAQTRQADVTMTACADMFEMGVKVQVLKNGTMFPMRAGKLYELYRRYASMDDIPDAERAMLEKSVFQRPLVEVWRETQDFFAARDPGQIVRAERDPKHKMALVFRWYLGQSSLWAKRGVPERRFDYQIWCGPAMGAFNEWARDSHLDKAEDRHVFDVNLNIIFGATAMVRSQLARVSETQPTGNRAGLTYRPLPVDVISRFLAEDAGARS